ncbi:M48 family metallopeptidase [Aliarcobacter butzleri]|nr:M48 family metallopeptidase [Aliarcobacter butzleri]MCT7635859.1 M48 family metallopeptidase [Aliarcobacter butzleri]
MKQVETLSEILHNDNFKALMDKYISDWQSKKEELKGIHISF